MTDKQTFPVIVSSNILKQIAAGVQAFKGLADSIAIG